MGSRFSNRLSELLLNPRFLLCFGIGWILTSGRSNVILTLGMLCRIRQKNPAGARNTQRLTFRPCGYVGFFPARGVEFPGIALGSLEKRRIPGYNEVEYSLGYFKIWLTGYDYG